MADFPIANDYSFSESFGYNLGSSTGTDLTSAGAGVSSWVELIASTADNIDLIELFFLAGTSGSFILARLDIGIGGAGSEVVIVEKLLIDGKPAGTPISDVQWRFPISVPAGTRIAFRADFTNASRVITLAGNLYKGSFLSPVSYSSLKSYGFNGRDGIDVDPGSTADTKGAWTEIVASLADNIKSFYVGISPSFNSGQSTMSCFFDISIATAGNEADAVIAQNIPFTATTGEKIRYHPFVDKPIPAGSRIAIRSQSTITDATDRISAFSIEGFR